MTRASALTMMLLTGCLEAPEPALGTVEQEAGRCTDDPTGDYTCRCAGCGGNGNTQRSWNATFSQMDRTALNNHGAWDWGADGPKSVCDPATITASGCTLRGSWSHWISASSVRVEMMTNLAKLVGPKDFAFRDPNGYTYYGMFGLAPNARGGSWGYADQEIVTAGLLALLNSVENVSLCLATERNTSGCVNSGAGYHESTVFGQVLRGSRFAGIAGGEHARVPGRNYRYGTVSQESATAYDFSTWRCAHVGNGENRYATHCDDDSGRRWQWPVVVLTPGRPADWFYDEPADGIGGYPKNKPILWP